MNMSYCRFSNTAQDLDDCADAIAYPEEEKLSKEEEVAKDRLVRLCRKIVNLVDGVEPSDLDPLP